MRRVDLCICYHFIEEMTTTVARESLKTEESVSSIPEYGHKHVRGTRRQTMLLSTSAPVEPTADPHRCRCPLLEAMRPSRCSYFSERLVRRRQDRAPSELDSPAAGWSEAVGCLGVREKGIHERDVERAPVGELPGHYTKEISCMYKPLLALNCLKFIIKCSSFWL